MRKQLVSFSSQVYKKKNVQAVLCYKINHRWKFKFFFLLQAFSDTFVTVIICFLVVHTVQHQNVSLQITDATTSNFTVEDVIIIKYEKLYSKNI